MIEVRVRDMAQDFTTELRGRTLALVFRDGLLPTELIVAMNMRLSTIRLRLPKRK